MEILLNNFDKIFTIFALLLLSLYVRILLQSMGQNWIKTIAHTATIALLPILTYVITSVISGNFALFLPFKFGFPLDPCTPSNNLR